MTYVLTALPWTTWQHARDQVARLSWHYWCDTDGVHVEEQAPMHCPLATHLWSWGNNVWGRWRIDPLAEPVGSPGGVAEASDGAPLVVGALLQQVDRVPGGVEAKVVFVETTSWKGGSTPDLRVGLVEAFRDRPVSLLQVTTPVNLTFVTVGVST